MTDRIPSTTDPNGSPSVDPTAVSVGDRYTVETDDGETETVEITTVQHGTDDDGDPVPTVVSYQTVSE